MHSLGLRWWRTGGLKGGCQVKLTLRKRMPAQQESCHTTVIAELQVPAARSGRAQKDLVQQHISKTFDTHAHTGQKNLVHIIEFLAQAAVDRLVLIYLSP